jgi:GAF domain-containing protein
VTSGRGLIGDAYRQAAVIKLERPVLDPRYCAEVDEDPVLINSIGSPLGSAAHILCVPIQSPSVGLVGVITLIRTHQQQQLFTKQQSQLSSKDSSSSINSSSFAFTDDQAAALYSLGEFVAAALRNGQLLEHTTSAYAASQNAQRRIGGMLDIAKALMSEHRLSTLVSFIIATVPELLDCDRCTLFFVDRRTNELIVTRGASHGRRTSVWQGSSSPGPATLTTSNGKVITLPISATTSPNSSFSAGSSSSSSSTSTNFSAAVTNAINNSASPAQAASTLAVAQQLSHGADDTSEGALPFRKSGEIRLPMDKGIAGYVATTGLYVVCSLLLRVFHFFSLLAHVCLLSV